MDNINNLILTDCELIFTEQVCWIQFTFLFLFKIKIGGTISTFELQRRSDDYDVDWWKKDSTNWTGPWTDNGIVWLIEN